MKSQRIWTSRRTVLLYIAAFWLGAVALGGQPDPPGQAMGAPPIHEAYLFAHMKHGDYGRLYYSVSLEVCTGQP